MDYFEYLNKKIESDYKNEDTKKILDKLISQAQSEAVSTFDDSTKDIKVDGNSIFHEGKSEDILKIDFNTLAKNLDSDTSNDNTENMTAEEYVLKEFLSLAQVKDKADKDKDGKLSAEELESFVKDLVEKDGDAKTLSLSDFDNTLKELNIDLSTVSNNNTAQATDNTSTQNTTSTSDAGSAGATGGGGASGVSYGPISGTNEQALIAEKSQVEAELRTKKEELKTNQRAKETASDDIKDKERELEKTKKGDNANIKAAKDLEEKAKKDYEKAVEDDEAVKELKNEITENNKNIEKNTKDLEENQIKTEKAEKERDEIETEVASLNNELSTLKDELSALPKPTGKAEDKDHDAAINAQKKQLEKLISQKRSDIEKKNKKLSNLKRELEQLSTKKTSLESEKTKLNEKRTELENKVNEKGSDKTKEMLAAYQEARAKTESVKAEEISNAQKAVEEAKKKETEATSAIQTTERAISVLEQKISDLDDRIRVAKQNPSSSYVSGGGGASGSSDAGYSYNYDTPAYTTAATGENTGKDFTYTGSSQAIKQAAIKAGYFSPKGTYTPKRGDIIIWTKTASTGHVGIVEKVYPDGSFDTIEGNSSNRVKRNHYSSQDAVGATFAGFCRASEWLGEAKAENAVRVAENELRKGVHENNGNNDSEDIARYKRGAHNNAQWCAYFTSYCFHDGQSTLT